jgi:spore coat polysaccharide biosynthesis predicted glycosyltransferase SpsG
MSVEKPYKKVVEELTDEVRSLKFVCSRLADTLEQDLKLRVTQEQHLTGIHEILEGMANGMRNANITIDAKVLQSIYAMVTNALNDTGLVRVLHKLDDVCYRLSERLKEMGGRVKHG